MNNYLKTTIRHLFKTPLISSITILGLVVGFSSFLFIVQFVNFEWKYDRFHEESENIYRVAYRFYENGGLKFELARTAPFIGPALKEEVSGIEAYTRMKVWSGMNLVSTQERDKTFIEQRIVFSDPTFFDVFSFPIKKGSSSAALEGPNKVMLSETTARKYFGDENPIGKTVILEDVNSSLRLKVTGIFYDIPENSHFKFDFLISYETFVGLRGEGADNSKYWISFYTYIKSSPSADLNSLEQGLKAFTQSHYPPNEEMGQKVAFDLQPLLDIHLHSALENELETNGSSKRVNFLLIVAVFIIVIAWVNYTNMAVAKSFDRSLEVGIRKIVGAGKTDVFKQFTIEAFLVNSVAMTLAIILFFSSQSFYHRFLGRDTFTDFTFTDVSFWLVVLGLFLIGVFVASIYPALLISSFKPITILKGKGKISNHGKGIWFRKALVTLQFAITTFLIVSTVIVHSQVFFLQNKDLGISIDNTLIINSPILVKSNYGQMVQYFKNELTKHHAIENVAHSGSVPGQNRLAGLRISRNIGEETSFYEAENLDYDFLDLYNIKLLAGRNFSSSNPEDFNSYIVMESLVKQLGFDRPQEIINKYVYLDGKEPRKVIGVVEDYHNLSLATKLTPIILRLNPTKRGFFSIKIADPTQSQEVREFCKEKFEAIFPDDIYISFMLKDEFNRLYDSQRKFGQILTFFSLVSIVLACLGLWGLTYFNAKNKSREIAIRKVFGGSELSILELMGREFLILCLVAFSVAILISYFQFKNWLEGFAYRISMEWWMFVVPCILLLAVVMITVFFQFIKVYRGNTLKSLRSD